MHIYKDYICIENKIHVYKVYIHTYLKNQKKGKEKNGKNWKKIGKDRKKKRKEMERKKGRKPTRTVRRPSPLCTGGGARRRPRNSFFGKRTTIT